MASNNNDLPSHNLKTPNEILNISGMSNRLNKVTWSYGITTVTSRANNTFKTTLKSLIDAGFDNPYLFIDGAKNQNQKNYMVN